MRSENGYPRYHLLIEFRNNGKTACYSPYVTIKLPVLESLEVHPCDMSQFRFICLNL